MRIRIGTLAASLLAGLLASVAAAGEPERLALARQALGILEANCYGCHGKDGTNEGGFNFVLDAARLVARKKVVPGDAGRSKLYRRLVSADNPMPPEDEKVRPGKAEVAVLKQWIEAGAPAAREATARRAFLSAADVVTAIRDDLAGRVQERDRRFTRYFTLTHLYNAGLSEDELQSYRHGLSKLVNSLSWGRRVVVPQAIDPARTVFRIDLRDYQWNEKVWDAILAVNPYGVSPATDAARECAALTECRLPFVRGDWFTAHAARPPLYHDVLQLPATEQELEKMLRVDVAEDIRQERVARAGFNSSGVSRNNRLIERHEAGSVTYWKSYDFASNTGRQNLFAHPLGPGDDEGSYRHDGGEIIFNLPNGLQGYMLATGAGKRIDKGPTTIVSDPRRPDRAVENGLSCMSCHAKGLIEKSDQVRDHILKNAAAFTQADVDTVLALYPPRDRFMELVRGDARRFQEAVAATGAPLSATEPVAALALRFEAELDLPLAAAEAGVTPAELLKALDRSALLAKELGSLRVEGGTVQRQVYVDAFGDLVEVLRLGEFQAPRNKALAKWIVQGDELMAKDDVAGAVRAYTEALALDPRSTLALNNRGLARSQQGEYDAAIADFTEALRLDSRLALAYHNRGSAHFRRGEAEEALADYTEALRLEPRQARFYNNRGFVHFDRGDNDKAIADYDQAVQIEPKFALAYNNRGLAYGRKGDHDRAVADFTQALRLDPKFARAYLNRGIAFEKKGDTARAVADRKKALELDPSLEKE
jgi:tetratricopeptide (TPR) repeat protein